MVRARPAWSSRPGRLEVRSARNLGPAPAGRPSIIRTRGTAVISCRFVQAADTPRSIPEESPFARVRQGVMNTCRTGRPTDLSPGVARDATSCFSATLGPIPPGVPRGDDDRGGSVAGDRAASGIRATAGWSPDPRQAQKASRPRKSEDSAPVSPPPIDDGPRLGRRPSSRSRMTRRREAPEEETPMRPTLTRGAAWNRPPIRRAITWRRRMFPNILTRTGELRPPTSRRNRTMTRRVTGAPGRGTRKHPGTRFLPSPAPRSGGHLARWDRSRWMPLPRSEPSAGCDQAHCRTEQAIRQVARSRGGPRPGRASDTTFLKPLA
jgi:hypothetical protein